MIKTLTCIECPKGCSLTVETDDKGGFKISGNECAKGERYAVSEVKNPVRILTSSVAALGLGLKMIPVRTDRPIPRDRLFQAMRELKKVRVKKRVHAGEVIAGDFMGLGVNLIATRSVKK